MLYCALKEASLMPLVEVVGANDTLKQLELVGMRGFGGEAAAALFKGLLVNTTLRVLNINNTSAGANVELLAEALQHNKSLEVLALGGSKLSAEQACKLLGALHGNTSLAHLDISDNDIAGEEFDAALVALVQHNAGLKTVDVALNQFGDQVVAQVVQALADNTKLLDFDMGTMNNEAVLSAMFDAARTPVLAAARSVDKY